MLALFPDEPGPPAKRRREGKPMINRQFVREGNALEQRRQELLSEVARHRSIRAARETEPNDGRPFAAPGSFLVFLKRHIASGRFRSAQPVPTTPAASSPTR